MSLLETLYHDCALLNSHFFHFGLQRVDQFGELHAAWDNLLELCLGKLQLQLANFGDQWAQAFFKLGLKLLELNEHSRLPLTLPHVVVDLVSQLQKTSLDFENFTDNVLFPCFYSDRNLTYLFLQSNLALCQKVPVHEFCKVLGHLLGHFQHFLGIGRQPCIFLHYSRYN